MTQKSRGIVLILVMITVSMFVVTPVSAAPPPKTWMRLPVNDYTWIINQNQSNLAEFSHASRTYQCVSTLWFTASADQKITLKKVELDVRTAGNIAYYKITYKFGFGAETTLVTDQLFINTIYVTKTHTCALNGDFGEALTVKIYTKVDDPYNGDTVYSKNYYMHYDVFNYDWNQWNRHGTEPWLDSDDGDANYIETSGCEYKQKYFEFEDLPAEISAEKVTLFVKLRDPDGATTGQHLRCYIWNGSQWFLGADWIYDVNTSWRLLCEDITSILDTESKIDNARVYFQKMTSGGHNIRITSCWLLIHDVRYETPPYSDEFTLTSGNGLASANITSGALHIQTLSEIICINSTDFASVELWKDVYIWEEIDSITIYYEYSARGLVKAQGLAIASAGLEIYVEDSSKNRIRTITLIDEYLEFNEVVPINKTDARYDVPLSIPSPGTYRIGVHLGGFSIVHGVGIGLCDFLTGGDGVQVSMIIYPNSPNADLTVRTYDLGENERTGVDVWIDSTQYSSPREDHTVACGDHIVEVDSVFYRGGYEYTFQHWENGDTSNPRTVSMTSDMTLRAYFQEEEREERYLTISAMSELGGTTIPSLGSHMYYEGTTVTVTASASSNYYFSHWLLDGIAVYEYPCEVTMNADHSLTAFFSFDGDGGGPGHDCHPWGGEDTPLP